MRICGINFTHSCIRSHLICITFQLRHWMGEMVQKIKRWKWRNSKTKELSTHRKHEFFKLQSINCEQKFTNIADVFPCERNHYYFKLNPKYMTVHRSTNEWWITITFGIIMWPLEVCLLQQVFIQFLCFSSGSTNSLHEARNMIHKHILLQRNWGISHISAHCTSMCGPIYVFHEYF